MRGGKLGQINWQEEEKVIERRRRHFALETLLFSISPEKDLGGKWRRYIISSGRLDEGASMSVGGFKSQSEAVEAGIFWGSYSIAILSVTFYQAAKS